MHRRLSEAFVVAVALLLAAPTASEAKLYKWVDADGNVTYSERKPPDVEAETLDIRGTGVSDEQAKEALEQLRDRTQTSEKDRDFEATASAEIKGREERLKRNCEIARQNMRVLQNSSRIQGKDDTGNPYFLDEAQIRARMEATAQQVKDNCG